MPGPQSHLALAGRARAAAALGDTEAAIAGYRAAIAISPQPDALAALGDLLALRGDQPGADEQYATVRAIARLQGAGGLVYNRQLALFERQPRPATRPRRWRLAERELTDRKDVYGYDAYAWALLANGRAADADAAMAKALALGTRDAMLLYHAGEIALRSATTRGRGRSWSRRWGSAARSIRCPLRARRDAGGAPMSGHRPNDLRPGAPRTVPRRRPPAHAVAALLRARRRGARPPATVLAHPLGNFTINHFAAIRVAPDRISLDVVIDRAEIPAFQEQQRLDLDGDGMLSPAERERAPGRSRASTLAARPAPGRRRDALATVARGGRALAAARRRRPADDATRVRVRGTPRRADRRPRRPWPSRTRSFAERIGWREIVVVGDGVSVAGATATAATLHAGGVSAA